MVPLVEVLVLVLVLLTGVAVFVRVQNSNKSAKVVDDGGVKKKAKSVVTQPAKVTYFTIKEFGVRFKLPDELKDLTYSYQVNANIPGAFFSTQTLIHKDTNCIPEEGPLGIISRRQAGTMVFDKPIEQYSGAKKIGNFYYIYESPQSPCSHDNNKEVEDLTIKQLQQFKAALSSDNLANLEAAPN